ncbi:MAG: DNA helicase [Phormidesmis sp.]
MKLSAPIYRLKREAKRLSREENIPLHKALNRIAAKEGFSRWSLLVARLSATAPARTLLARLKPGDLLLLGGRPGHGKMQLSLQLTIEAIKSGCQGAFFTLEYGPTDVLDLFKKIEVNPTDFRDTFSLHDADTICAEYIMAKLSAMPTNTLAVIDYLQILDQRRENPELIEQIRTLKAFANEHSFILVFISQIDRSYNESIRKCPGLDDVRLPNPLDLRLFSKACFLNNGELEFLSIM